MSTTRNKQVFSIIIEFSEDSINGRTAYQKQDEDNWNSFKAVDSYEIRNTLREGKSVTDYTGCSGERMVLQGGGLRH